MLVARARKIWYDTMFGETVNAWSDARAFVLDRVMKSVQAPSTPMSTTNKRRRISSTFRDGQAGPSGLHARDRTPTVVDEEDAEERRRKRRRLLSPIEDIVPTSDPEEQELSDPTLTNPLVECPLCSQRVPYNSINSHVDSKCKTSVTGESDAAGVKPDPKTAWGSLFKGHAKKAVSSARDLEIPTTRIAKVSYGVLGVGAIRRLLAEKGLPTNGDKEDLIARHERWIAIFNANLDRPQPRTVGDLKERLKELEETSSRPATRKIVDEKAWAQKNKAQFDSLIAAARPKVKPSTETTNPQTVINDNGPSTSSSMETDRLVPSDVIVIE
ncbi:hypothetical protein K439DRAFT_90699 [Ramaria rubella]|nr:hypothetical protein K439DRAFT_90699 [Ramaria rubella]